MRAVVVIPLLYPTGICRGETLPQSPVENGLVPESCPGKVSKLAPEIIS